LEGLEPTHVDWHAKVNLYKIENKIFLKDDSAPEIGTTTATINRTGKTNAKKGVDDYNAYRDFHDREVEGHILAAFMVFCGMENMEDVPSKFQLPLKSEGRVERRNWLHKLIREFLREFVFDTQESNEVIQEVNRLDRQQREGYACRICGRRYQGDAWRVRHEIITHGLRVQDTPEEDPRNSFGYFKCPNVNCGLVFRTNATLKRYIFRIHWSNCN